MNVGGNHFYSIWKHPENNKTIQIIDQRQLPFKFVVEDLLTLQDVYNAIKEMHVRGAPLIGVTAAYGMYIALNAYDNSCGLDEYIIKSANYLKSSRPTAINLVYAINKQINILLTDSSIEEKIKLALQTADGLFMEELENSKKIGLNGLKLIEEIYNKKNKKPVNILTHCNAGWLACVDYGTATSPIYMAHDKGINIHVWVDETRPLNQGAKLTIWELQEHGVPCTLITDNAGGHIMQKGLVDIVIVGSDRTSINGDVANKIGTYLKALAAFDNHIPFYVALPSSSIDWQIKDAITEIPIEERDDSEVKYIYGLGDKGLEKVLVTDAGCNVKNYGFDITPARLITKLITERGICNPIKTEIVNLFKEKVI